MPFPHPRLLRGEVLPGVPALPAPLWVLASGCPIVDSTLLQGGHAGRAGRWVGRICEECSAVAVGVAVCTGAGTGAR